MKKFIVVLMLLTGQIPSFGQAQSVQRIDSEVARIDNNRTLVVKEFDADEIYEQVTDGGGTFKIYFENGEIKKVEEQIGLSFGRNTTVIYFLKGKPVKIIDSEENFKLKSDSASLDYTKLKKIFECTIYVFDWDLGKQKAILMGKRNHSEGTCAISDYEGIINQARKWATK